MAASSNGRPQIPQISKEFLFVFDQRMSQSLVGEICQTSNNSWRHAPKSVDLVVFQLIQFFASSITLLDGAWWETRLQVEELRTCYKECLEQKIQQDSEIETHAKNMRISPNRMEPNPNQSDFIDLFSPGPSTTSVVLFFAPISECGIYNNKPFPLTHQP
jgi:hypothetical protein